MKPSTAKVLHLLRVRGVEGLTENEALRWAGVGRAAPRVKELRDAGYEVMTLSERHPGGTHARWVLREPVGAGRPQPMTPDPGDHFVR